MSEREDFWREFEAMAKRPLKDRINYGFIKTYRPVLDDQPYRSFESMEEYRQWCEENLPSGWALAAFEYRQAEEIRAVFERHSVSYLFIGKAGVSSKGCRERSTPGRRT